MKKRIDRNTEIIVQSNIHASFSYQERGVSLELSHFGDEDYITFGDLKKMASGSSKSILQNMYILITGIYDDEFEVDDVIRQLKLEKHYNQAKKTLGVTDIEIEDFQDFVEESTAQELKKAFEDNENLKEVLVESALELYKKRTIDIDKMQTALEACNIDNLYYFLEDLSLSER